LAVITRTSATAKGLKGDTIRDEFCGKSKSARRINIAVQRMLNREPREAAQIVERELCRIVFGDEKTNPRAVEGQEIDRAKWRAAIFDILTAGIININGETWNDWLERVKLAVKDAAVSLDWVENKEALRSYMKCNTEGVKLRKALFEIPVTALWQPTATVTTVHKVKGAEFDTVVLFVRKPHKIHAPCPSIEWWSGANGAEEKRIAFVAVSRAKQHFVLCVHSSTHEELKREHPEFLALFDETLALP